jgi:hypothetical protein
VCGGVLASRRDGTDRAFFWSAALIEQLAPSLVHGTDHAPRPTCSVDTVSQWVKEWTGEPWQEPGNGESIFVNNNWNNKLGTFKRYEPA